MSYRHNDSHDKKVLEIPLINQSSDIQDTESNQIPLEPQQIHIRNNQYILNAQTHNQSSSYNSTNNFQYANNNTPSNIKNPQVPLLMQANPLQTQAKGNAQQALMAQNMQMAQNQQGGQFNPQMQQMQAMMMNQNNPQMIMNPNQQMMMNPNQQMLMQQQIRPVVQLTPAEIERKRRREEEKQKFKRHIPEEDPSNMIVKGGYQSILYSCGNCCGSFGQYCPCCSNPNVQVNNSYKGIYERFGKYVKTVESGLHFVNPCTDSLIQIDVKTQNIDLGMQQSLTQDNILLFVHGVVQYRVVDCRKAFYSITDIDFSVKELSICALRSTISQFKFQELLDNRDIFRKKMEEFVDEYIHDWGVDVEQIIIKDMNMDPNIQQSLASAAKEVRLAQAKILNAKADVVAAEEQRKAADQLASKSAMQIRFLGTLERIASKSKVVFLGEN